MQRKAIALLRVSTEGQARQDRASLPAQRAEIQRIAQLHELDLVQWVELAGVSGTAVLRDPRFAALLARLEEPEIHGVVVAAFDRLMRPESLADYAILESFRSTATVLYTMDGPRDLRTFDGRMLSVMQGEMGAYERRRIVERSMASKELKRRDGFYTEAAHQLPYGVDYRIETDDSGAVRPVWSYHEPEAENLRHVYRLLLAGERNFCKISREVGVSRHIVRKAVTDPIYAGRHRIDKRWPDKWRPTLRNPDEVIEVQVLDPPLIDYEAWSGLNELLSDRPTPSREHDGSCLYHGLASCAACGSPIHTHRARFGTPPYHYRCGRQAKRAGGERCRTGQFAARHFDAEVDRVLAQHLGDAARIAELLEAAFEAEAGDPVGPPDPEAVQKRIEALETERRRVITSYESGFRELRSAERRVREIDRTIGRLREVEADEPAALTAEDLALRIAEPFRCWGALNRREKRELLEANVQRLFVEKSRQKRARGASVPRVVSVALRSAHRAHGSVAAAGETTRNRCGVVVEIPAGMDDR